VYQRYLGYFDGVPAHLNPHPPVAAGQRYVAALGGAERVLELGAAAFADGDFRWTAELVNHLVFSDPENEAARLLLADAYEQLAYQAESGVWRNIYLTGAKELRDNGNPFRGVNFSATGGGQVHNLTMDLVIDVMGIRLNGPAAAATQFACDVTVSSRDNEAWHFAIEHGVIHGGPGHVGASTRLRGPGPELARIFCASAPLAEMEHVVVEGDAAALTNYLSLLDDFSFGFDIALP
jgi:alkyl sulfatase BDS1-like metallo-beta-lactamase superfamily hydrolase